MSKYTIEYLRWRAEVMGELQHLPHSASKKLKELLLDDSLSAQEFEIQLDQIFKSTRTVGWQMREAFSNFHPYESLKVLLLQIPWVDVSIMVCSLVVFYFLYNNFKTNKVFSLLFSFFTEILNRVFSVGAYFFPFLEIMNAYTPPLMRSFPYLKFVLNDTMKLSLFIYQNVPAVGFIYFCVVYGLLIRNRQPRSRLVRFHLALGLLIMNLHQPLTQIFRPLSHSLEGNKEGLENICIVFFYDVLIYFLPCVYKAATGQYIKNAFLRDAVEIILGRDEHDPNFKWWDR